MRGVSLVPVSEFAGQLPDQRVNGALNGGALKGISQIAGGVKLVPDGANFTADIQSDTPQNAASLAGALQFLGGLAMMSSQQPPPALTAAMNSLKVAANGNTVTVNFSVPESLLETAQARRTQQRRTAPGVRPRAR